MAQTNKADTGCDLRQSHLQFFFFILWFRQFTLFLFVRFNIHTNTKTVSETWSSLVFFCRFRQRGQTNSLRWACRSHTGFKHTSKSVTHMVLTRENKTNPLSDSIHYTLCSMLSLLPVQKMSQALSGLKLKGKSAHFSTVLLSCMVQLLCDWSEIWSYALEFLSKYEMSWSKLTLFLFL